ncbi:hypothetical protein R3P38DRAFT_3245029 [Favolaschia claudopus]|uniref:Uncharacterized protein n=1 Tax=Favolaschia claudopus TaxID=2862362 RepID=A0AAV9Z166_9AGAR
MPQDATTRKKKKTNHEKTNHRSAPSKNTDHCSSRSRRKNHGSQSQGDKENSDPSDDEISALRARNKQLEQLCQSNGVTVPAVVDGVADRSIPKPQNLKKEVNINVIRAHMGIEGAGSKQVWLNCRRAVRNNLTRAGFEYEVDDASQDPMKKAHCIQAIEHERPLFKRFKASWGAQYVLREVWSNRNEWLDKTNKDPPTTNNNSGDSNDHGGEDDGQGGEDDDDDDEGDSMDQQDHHSSRQLSNEGSPRQSRKRAHALSPPDSSNSEDDSERAPPKKRAKQTA